MKVSLSDRLVCALTYFTFGIFGVIWLVFGYLTKKRTSSFVMFAIMQAFFLSVVLAAISIIYDIAFSFLSPIPFIGKIVNWFDIVFNHTPMYFSFTFSGFLITLLILYLVIFSILGKRAQIPYISKTLSLNFGE